MATQALLQRHHQQQQQHHQFQQQQQQEQPPRSFFGRAFSDSSLVSGTKSGAGNSPAAVATAATMALSNVLLSPGFLPPSPGAFGPRTGSGNGAIPSPRPSPKPSPKVMRATSASKSARPGSGMAAIGASGNSSSSSSNSSIHIGGNSANNGGGGSPKLGRALALQGTKGMPSPPPPLGANRRPGSGTRGIGSALVGAAAVAMSPARGNNTPFPSASSVSASASVSSAEQPVAVVGSALVPRGTPGNGGSLLVGSAQNTNAALLRGNQSTGRRRSACSVDNPLAFPSSFS